MRKIPEIITGKEVLFQKRNHWILPKLRTIQPDYCFFYHLRYNCWILYKYIRSTYNSNLSSYRGKYIRIIDCERFPGYWLYNYLIKVSLLKDRFRKKLTNFMEKLESPCQAEINSWKKQVEIYHEANKDLTMALSGRCSIQLSNIGPASVERKRKKKKIYVGLKTGRILGYES